MWKIPNKRMFSKGQKLLIQLHLCQRRIIAQMIFFTKSGSEKFDFSTPEVTANVPKTNQAFLSSDLDISVIDSDVEGRNTSSLLGCKFCA
ncbi:uncharacterized protein LOC118187496 isoform X2 [Stegodyphus dumicola]|uniref:uncharacterized protein LOC118187496 isoform X2 n=1 Tax=Stegodyphus dumicola TaxID=202533 RepID=UPI0015A94038|nr:uncharacterized protein LOC118187496 isoform X2 [Stegodyphus dumicola]